MLLKTPLKQLPISSWVIGLIILLSGLAFSNSTAATTDSRKPADRETIIQNKISVKRSISFQHGRQLATWTEFITTVHCSSLRFSIGHAQMLDRLPCKEDWEKLCRPQICCVVMLHAPRSSDLTPPPVKG